MNERWVFDCPLCGQTRDFTASGDFIAPNGERAHTRLCVVCEYKRYFTLDGIQFSRSRSQGVRKSGINTNELSSPINKDQRQKTPITPKKSPLTRLQAFINQESNLNSKEKGLQFEKFCEQLLKAMGYQVKRSGQSGDKGVDLRASRQEPIGNQTLVIQCKNQQSVSADVVIQLYGMATAETPHLAVVITTGKFTAAAQKFAREHSNIVIIDSHKLTKLTNRYLES